MKMQPAPQRPRFVCPECQERLVHRISTLHAEEDTILVCGGVWESLPQWARDAFTGLERQGRTLSKRWEAVREIREFLKGRSS